MLRKVIATIGFSFLMVISSIFTSIPVFAVEDINEMLIISPQYIYINSASSSLSISGGTATIKGNVQKTPTGKDINLTCTLQKKSNGSWSDVKSWSKSTSTSPSVYISEKYTVSKGEYRVAAYYSVSGANGTESGTVYSKTVTY